MATWSSSPFIQALGWATLNSFWQIGALWLLYISISQLVFLSSTRKYDLATGSIFVGFGAFLYTFFTAFNTATLEKTIFFNAYSNSSIVNLQPVLTVASAVYLGLLLIPAYRLFISWNRVQIFKTQGLQKADYTHRLFIRKMRMQLGIKKIVSIYVSELITSPVTIGYLKPMILLPVAALNNLSFAQVEAVLVHELSHIKRHDYLINLFINFIHVLLYFNPFLKFFIKAIEVERENCCDELVLQFEYDKYSYASALVSLEKQALTTPLLAIGATGKKYLLNRIEKITGSQKKTSFQILHFTGVFLMLICFFVLHSFFKTIKPKETSSLVNLSFHQDFTFFTADDKLPINEEPLLKKVGVTRKIVAPGIKSPPKDPVMAQDHFSSLPIPETHLTAVANDNVTNNLTYDQKNQVSATVQSTKKILETVQWNEVEKSIADALTAAEKEMAKREYLNEIENIDWKTLEQNLKMEYEHIDWEEVNGVIKQAFVISNLDSLQTNYKQALKQIEKTTSASNAQPLPIPDVSLQQLKRAKTEIQGKIDTLKHLRAKKIVRL